MKTITLTLDYYGNKNYGKRAFWIEGTDNCVMNSDFLEWAIEKKQQGYKLVITNAHEVSKSVLELIK